MAAGKVVMPSAEGVDTVLELLLATTESLRDSARVFSLDEVSELLAQRRQAAASLTSILPGATLSADQRDKLRQAIVMGEEARDALLIKRETTRSELQEKLAGRQLSEQFRPYQPKKAGRLNIKL